MERIDMEERPHLRALATEVGFKFFEVDGTTYWDESHAYQFTLEEIETMIEDPTQELEGMCLDVAGRVVESEELMQRLRIPEPFRDLARDSWLAGEKNFYGRMDFSYNGKDPAKLLEYNADTPTALYESSAFQWVWLEEMRTAGKLPKDADQFNSIEEQIIGTWERMGIEGRLHLTHVAGSDEDEGTVTYLQYLANKAGLHTVRLPIEQIGVDAEGRFTDLDNYVIDNLFKLYPWEHLIRDEFAKHLLAKKARIIEPAWKLILSNKGLMALLWEFFPGHDNLLPTFFEEDTGGIGSLGKTFVRKPLLSREGANVEIYKDGFERAKAPGEYGAEGWVHQALHPLPLFDEDYAVIGSWVVASKACGIGIREDKSMITRNTSRFVPHFFIE